MAVGGAKLALLLIHILSVAGNEYSCSQDNDHGGDDHEHRKKLISSLKSGFVIGYVFSSVSVITIFMSYCVPWASLMKRKGNEVMMKTPMMTSLMERQEMKRKEANVQASARQQQILAKPTKLDWDEWEPCIWLPFLMICMLGNIVKRLSFVGTSKATENFSQANKIGLGRMGTMYMATLTNESNTRLLVYKYMSNGNLFDWIHSVKHRRKTLQWPLRLKVAVGVARGLARLHHGCRGQVVHLNISSKCILLDKNFEPKLSNFGKAMLAVHDEFCEMALVKEDVHGFGVLLLELITGMDCSRMNFSSNSILNEWIGNLLSTSYFNDAMDRFLIGQGFDDEIFQLLKVACNCLDCIPDRRPSMFQVYKDIKAITKRSEVVDDSEIQMQPEICPATSQD
ncbi:inactive leucine-rich repeat receptor-like protein kinase [Populus alba x Populus x berolinensis]|nr:inactive leucine-rich repeat receptor-like protein kinase [Populus alba x Populus x berolinensis]